MARSPETKVVTAAIVADISKPSRMGQSRRDGVVSWLMSRIHMLNQIADTIVMSPVSFTPVAVSVSADTIKVTLSGAQAAKAAETQLDP